MGLDDVLGNVEGAPKFEAKPIPFAPLNKIGFRTKVKAYSQDPDGNRTYYETDFWVRKEDVAEVIAQKNKSACTLVLKGNKPLDCSESFDVIIGKIER